MGLFEGVQDAKATMSPEYEKAGRYIHIIRGAKEIETRKNGPGLVMEKTVVAVIDDNLGEGHREGQQVSHLMLQKYDSFLGNVKAMIAGIMGIDPESPEISGQEWLETCNEMVSPEQPLAGRFIECSNRNITTRAGNDFTIVNYVRSVSPREAYESAGDRGKALFSEEQWEQYQKEYEAQ